MINMKSVNEPIFEDVFDTKDSSYLEFCIRGDLSDTAEGVVAQKVHRHPFYEMIYIEECDGEHIVDYISYSKLENVVFLIRPGQTHYWKNVTKAKGKLFYFTENFLFNSSMGLSSIWEIQLFRNIADKPAVYLNDEQRDFINVFLDMMLKEYEEKKTGFADVLRSSLNILLVYFQRLHNEVGEEKIFVSEASEIMERFENMIDQKINENLSVKDYAQELGVSTGYLNVQTKKAKGISSSALIKRAQITEIKRLLMNTALNITEISDRMNFQDPAYFCRFFKKESGKSPTDFRKEYAIKNTSYRQ